MLLPATTLSAVVRDRPAAVDAPLLAALPAAPVAARAQAAPAHRAGPLVFAAAHHRGPLRDRRARGQEPRSRPTSGPILGVILGLSLVAHVANRWLVPNANAVVLPIAALLNGIGYVVIVRWTPAGGQGPGHLGGPRDGALRRSPCWSSAAPGTSTATATCSCCWRGFLLVAPLSPTSGSTINGARLWVHFGPLEFQPVEIAKILLCIFFASYFAEKKELLSIPTARLGNRLVLDPRPAHADPVGLGLRHAGHRRGERHRLRHAHLHHVHRHAVGHHRALGLPGLRGACCSPSGPSWPPTSSPRSTSGSPSGSTPGPHRHQGSQLTQGDDRHGPRRHRRVRARPRPLRRHDPVRSPAT